MSTTHPDVEGFKDEYVDEHLWKEGRDIETLEQNVKKYALPLRGTDNRPGFFQWLQEEREKHPSEVTPKDVKRFLTFLKKTEGLSDSMMTQARSGISQYYQLMLEDIENPVADLEASWTVKTDKEAATGEQRVYLERKDVEAMVENVPTPTLRSELIIRLLYQTGVRVSELVTMEVGNVDRESHEINVYADKTDEWRTVGYQGTLERPLGLWIDGKRRDEPGWFDGNPYLFPSLRNRDGDADHISTETIRQTVVGAAENAGLQEAYGTDARGQTQNKITPHTLRHTFAVHSAENGVPAPHLKQALGHHSLDVTQIYTNIAGEDAVDMLKSKGPAL